MSSPISDTMIRASGSMQEIEISSGVDYVRPFLFASGFAFHTLLITIDAQRREFAESI